MVRLFTYLGLWLIATGGFAQPASNQMDGYILPSEGDTIFGEVAFINPVHNQISVTFKPYDSNKKRTYSPQDLIAYAFWNVGNRGEDALVVYRRKRIPFDPVENINKPRTVFLQLISEGDLDLYHFYSLDIQRINDREYVRSFFIEDLSPDGMALTHLSRDNFKDVAPQVLQRNDYLSEHLGQPGFGFKYLPEMIHFHNNLNAAHAHWLIADQ